MKRHLTLASGGRLAAFAREVGSPQSAPAGRSAGTLWRHTLILEGRLDERSRLELEDEVDCLHQEGVTSLRLDLRRLQEVDAAGVQALVSLAMHWRRRGQDIDVIPGAGSVGRALDQAGVPDLLASEGLEPRFAGSRGPVMTVAAPSRSTTTVKGLT
jgi:anti-anti-sigma regulatory factor